MGRLLDRLGRSSKIYAIVVLMMGVFSVTGAVMSPFIKYELTRFVDGFVELQKAVSSLHDDLMEFKTQLALRSEKDKVQDARIDRLETDNRVADRRLTRVEERIAR